MIHPFLARRSGIVAAIATTAILVLGVGTSLHFYLVNQESVRDQLRQIVLLDTAQSVATIRSTIQNAESGISAVADSLKDNASPSPSKFHSTVIANIPNLPGKTAVILLSPGGENLEILHGSAIFGLEQGMPVSNTPAGAEILRVHTGTGGIRSVRAANLPDHAGRPEPCLVIFPDTTSANESTTGSDHTLPRVVGIFSIDGLLDSALDPATTLDYIVHFDAAGRGDARNVAFQTTPVQIANNPFFLRDRQIAETLARALPIPLGEQSATLRFVPTPQWLRRSESLLPLVVLVLGLTMSGLISAIVIFNARRASAIERMVVERTAELEKNRASLDHGNRTLASVLEACPEAILGKDDAGAWTFANRAFLELARVPPDFKYAGLTDEQILARCPGVSQSVLSLQDHVDQQSVRGGSPARIEVVIERPELGRLHIDLHVVPIRDADGLPLGRVLVHNNITELRKRIIALQRSRERVKLLVDRTATAIIEWNNDHRVINCNPAACRLFGFDRTDLIGKGTLFFADPDDRDNAGRALASSLADRSALIPSTFRHISPRGGELLCEWQHTPIIGDDGRVLGVTSFVYNITERQKAEEALRKRDNILQTLAVSTAGFLDGDSWEPDARELLRRLVETLAMSRVHLVRTPDNGSGTPYPIFRWNNPLQIPDHFEREETSDSNTALVRAGLLNDILDGRQSHGSSSSYREALRRILKSDAVRSVLFIPIQIKGDNWGFLRFDQCDKERVWSADELSALRVVGSVLAGAVTRQVLAKERLQMEKRLLLAQKRESLGTLAGGLARDFNQLLNNILGSASLARAMADADTQIDDCLANIETSGLRAASLCREMLAFSGRGQAEAGLVSPNLLTLDVLNSFEGKLANNLVIRKNLENGIPIIEGDIESLRHALHAVVSNAVEAIGSSPGLLEISTTPLPPDPAQPGTDYVAIRVRDSGPGMPVEIKDRVFDPFFSTKMAGRGLGLTNALSTVEAHGGHILVDSEPGAGATLTIILPCTRPEPVTPAQSSPTDHRHAEATGTVLVLHSGGNPIRDFINGLHQLGFRTEELRDVDDALRTLHQKGGNYRLIAIDPAIAGIEAATLYRLRALSGTETIILLTDEENCPPSLRHLASEGMATFVGRNIGMHELRMTIQESLGQTRY